MDVIMIKVLFVADWRTLATSHNLPAHNDKIWPIKFSNQPNLLCWSA